MLGAHFLALTALDAVSRFPEPLREMTVEHALGCPRFCLEFLQIRVIQRKVLGDCDIFRTVVDTVGTAGTGYSVIGIDDICNFFKAG